MEPEPLLSPDDLVTMLKVPKPTIYGWRTSGEGPPASKVGRHLRYRLRDVEEWLDGQRTTS
jgi:predicted DNA-binding transcriptional regulator AlpA